MTAVADPVVPPVETPPAAVVPPVPDPVVPPVADPVVPPVVPPVVEPPKPVDYTLVLPKDSTLDASALEKTAAIARELGLSDTAAAQKVLDLVHEQSAAHTATVLAAHQPGGAEWTKQLDAWKAETLADQSLGKTAEERTASVALAGTVLRQYKEAHPTEAANIDAFMNTSGLGEHPAVVRLFHWLGKAAGERSLVRGNDTSMSAGDKLDAMYPSMKKS